MSSPFAYRDYWLVLPRGAAVLALSMVAALAVGQQVVSSQYGQLLDESEYRTEMEEVVVQGEMSEWRRAELQQQEWRRDRFELPEQQSSSRMQWMPAYSHEERDDYQGVRDRMGEEPAIKVFEFSF